MLLAELGMRVFFYIVKALIFQKRTKASHECQTKIHRSHVNKTSWSLTTAYF